MDCKQYMKEHKSFLTFVSCAYVVCCYLFFAACGVATSSLQKDGYSLLHCEVQSQVSKFLDCVFYFHHLSKIVIFGALSTFTQPNGLICQMSMWSHSFNLYFVIFSVLQIAFNVKLFIGVQGWCSGVSGWCSGLVVITFTSHQCGPGSI